MSTTEQRTPDAEATPAGRSGWAVPGVAHSPAGSSGSDTTGPGSTPTEASAASSSRASGSPAPEGDLMGDRVDDLAGDLAAELTDTAAGGPETPEGGHPVVAAVLACLEALETTRTASVGTLTTKEIRLMLLAVAQIIAAAFALKLRLLAAGTVQRVEDLTGATSTGAFLAHLTQMRRPDAAAQVRLAVDLDTRYPLLADALARGLLSPDQLTVCVSALRRLPKDLPADQLDACQSYLIDACQRLTPTQLRVVGHKLWEVIDPDGAEKREGKALEDEERQARARASIRFWDNGDGTTGFRGKLPHLQAAILQKAIHAFANPRRRKNPNIPTGQPDDTRHQPGPTESTDNTPGNSPGHSATDDSKSPHGSGNGTQDPDRPPGGPPGGPPGFVRSRDERDDGDLSPEERDTGRVIPYPIRLGHALMDLIERLPRNLLPHYGGVPATIVATMTLDQLRTGLGTATLDTGGVASAGQLRRLACNAGIIPAVLDGPSQPLDLGREKRLFTTAQRIAMDLRDHGGTSPDEQGTGCVIDGCDRPASVCDAHHPIAWEHGGETNLDNAILICPYHHHRAHDTRWQLTHTNGTWRLRRVTD